MKYFYRVFLCGLILCEMLQAKGAANADKFILWQLPSQVNTIGNSYVIKTDNGKIIVIDGGMDSEESYLRGFLGALGNKVDCWFVSHPHADHVGALTKILEKPKDLRIRRICQSTLSDSVLNKELAGKKAAIPYYEAVRKSGIPVIEARPGMIFRFGHTKCKILGIKNEDLKVNVYNNSSVVIRIWDPSKSVLFLGDAGEEEGDRLLNGPYRKDLDCDYIQIAHHGQRGVSMNFYKTVKFKACLWPTPSWVYNNDIGKGFNTYTLKTMETRNTIKSLGIKKQYFSFQGLTRIE